MWFNPAEIKNTEPSPPANSANSANYRIGNRINSINIINGKISKISEISSTQTVEIDDRHYCRACKNLSGKFCRSKKEKVIDDVVRRCSDYSANGLELAPIANIANIANYKTVICGDCLHFKCHNKHGKGAGLCLAGIGFVLWSDTLHECGTFDLPMAN